MIRLVQRRLIIPRGDSGEFVIPVLAAPKQGDVAVFTIFNPTTRKKIFTKEIKNASGENITISFSHLETVNLPVGRYFWDIKIYSDPVYLDDELVDGTEVDSYYSAYKLPECEIRPTGDALLTADDAPTATISPEYLNILATAVSDALKSKQDAASSAEDASDSAEAAADSAAAAEQSASEIKDLSVEATTLATGSSATASYDSDTGVLSLGIPRGDDYILTNQDKADIAAIAEAGLAPSLDGKADKADTILTTTLSRGRKANTVVGTGSVAFGDTVTATGNYSVAIGNATVATGNNSYAEGSISVASGYSAHAEGCGSLASGEYSHAEGYESYATGNSSHAEGNGTTASGVGSHTEGFDTVAQGDVAHAEGYSTYAKGERSHAEGVGTGISGTHQFRDGSRTGIAAVGEADHTEGYFTSTISDGAHTNHGNHAEGYETVAGSSAKQVNGAHAEGYQTSASYTGAHSEGVQTIASAYGSHAEGVGATASAYSSHVEGHATTASGTDSHAEGGGTDATGAQAHAEGAGSTASGAAAHAEGADTLACKDAAHSEGSYTIANGIGAHAEGDTTIATGTAVHAGGKFNVDLNANNVTMAQIIGNGTGVNSRSNAYALSWAGDGYYAGDVYVNCDANSANGSKLAKLSDVPDVPSWALAAEKPTYTAAEVGATTSGDVSDMIAAAMQNINSFDVEVVQELPISGIKEHTVYFVPKTGATNDVYDEYIRVNDGWEMIGNTQIDLSSYATKAELPTVVSDLTNDAGYLVSADLATVAATGEYSDLNNTPAIPAKISDLTNDSDFVRQYYGECNTAGDTAAKQVTISNLTSFTTGTTIAVKFAAANTASNPKLEINGGDQIAIYRSSSVAGSSASASWPAGSIVLFTYDGTNWVINNYNNTTYNSMTDAQVAAGTSTSNLLLSPARLKTAVQTHAPVQSVNGKTGAVQLNAVEYGNFQNLTAAEQQMALANLGLSNEALPISDDLYVKRAVSGGNKVKIDGIVGGTVCFNQLTSAKNTSIDPPRTENNSPFTLTNAEGGQRTFTSRPLFDYVTHNGHKYLASWTITNAVDGGGASGTDHDEYRVSFAGGQPTMTVENGTFGKIIEGDESGSGHKTNVYVFLRDTNSATGSITVSNLMLFDLTQMFGASVADYIYNLQATTAGAGFAFFRNLFPNSYYPYNAGELVSVAATGRKTVGFNLWDGTYDAATWITNDDTGVIETDKTGYNLTDFIPVFPSTIYYHSVTNSVRLLCYDSTKTPIPGSNTVTSSNYSTFTTPANAAYMRFTLKDDCLSNFILNLSDTTKNGTYETYTSTTYNFDSDLTLRGVPVIDNGVLKYDGDEYAPNGTVTRRYGIVDLGTLDWNQDETDHGLFGTTGITTATTTNSTIAHLLCQKYPTVTSAIGGTGALDKADKSIFARTNGTIIWIKDSDYSSGTADDFETALSGVYLVYELATPTTESADPYTAIQDAGTTEEFLGTSVPVGARDCYYCAQSLVDVKADKVQSATSGNFAALDASGNLVDSGHKHSDYLTEHQSLSNYVQKTDFPSGLNAGVVRVSNSLGVDIVSGYGLLTLTSLTHDLVKGGDCVYAVSPTWQHEAAFYGLAKAAGADEKNSTESFGTYSTAAKAAIRTMIGAAASSDVTVTDVQVDGTSAVSNGIANIPAATATDYGLIKATGSVRPGSSVNGGTVGGLYIKPASDASVKAGSSDTFALSPSNQHLAAFYGLAKVAGANMNNSNNAAGTYTAAAKGAIQKMLGVTDLFGNDETSGTASKAYAVGEVFTYGGKLYKVTAAIAQDGAIVVEGNGANCSAIDIANDYVKNTDYATSSKAGVVKTSQTYGTTMTSGALTIAPASSDNIKGGTNTYKPITPSKQEQAVFYGLAKVAGVDLASETVTLGTYPATASAAIRTMIGAVGTSDYATGDNAGVVKVGSSSDSTGESLGVYRQTNGLIRIAAASIGNIKGGVQAYKPIVSATVDAAAFYGLAKAAGDTTQSSSNNEVGNYTAEAKGAIRAMLDIDNSVVEEYVTGTTPTITAGTNCRYICGEVSSVSFTPCATGTCELMFTSGSTVAVLTLPNTVKMPDWFVVETNTIYNIMITNGVYGAVMSWPL